MTQPTSEALSDDPFPDSPVFEKVEEDHGATPTYMIVVKESWRESILCGGMYGWAADWLVRQLNDLEGVRKDRLVGLAEAVTSRTFAAMQESLDQALARCEAAERRVEELTAACVEIDTYLANDPLVWRIVSVAKAGDVLCDVLGSEVIGAINRSAHCESEHCPYCVPVLVRENAE